ncbi:MAG: recombination protein O N-terminal domain-containing protein [Muribaculaceae bacterium]|nr:recombination protein O N-terminal domain-containing protein [Muribaculaceae bacterium]
MNQTLHCIALRSIAHSDSQYILSVWSAEAGLISVSVPAAHTPAARRIRALTMPLSMFEAVTSGPQTRPIKRLKDYKPWRMTSTLSSDISRLITAEFLTDWLEAVLRHAPQDTLFTDFLAEGLVILNLIPPADVMTAALWIMFRLTHFYGIMPDLSREGDYLSIPDGYIMRTAPASGIFFTGADLELLRRLGKMEISTSHGAFSRTERRRLIDILLTYYTAHHIPCLNLRALETLDNISA